MTTYMNLRSGNSGVPFVAQNDQDTLLWSAAHGGWYTGPSSGGGSVTSVFGRTGAVAAATGDYDSDQIDNVSTVAGASVSDALETLAASAGAVASVFGRTGVVLAQTGDYTSTQVTNSSSVAGTGVTGALNTLFTRIITADLWQGGLREVANLAARNAIPVGNRDVGMTVYQVDTDQMWRLIGGIANGNFVDVTIGPVSATAAGVVPAVGGVSFLLQSTGTAAAWVAPLLWDATFLAPTITQTATGSATGQTMLVQAQNALTTGGRLKLQSGTGGTTQGELAVFVGATQVSSFQRATTDFVAMGAAPSGVGYFRSTQGVVVAAKQFSGGSVNISLVSTSTTDQATFGDGTNSALTSIDAQDAGGWSMKTAGVVRLNGNSTVMVVSVPAILIAGASAASGLLMSIQNSNSGSNATSPFRLRAQGVTSGNTNGQNVELEGGRLNGTGLSGRVVMKLNQDDTQANMWPMAEVAMLGVSRRVTAVCFPGESGAGVTSAASPTGDLMLLIGNCATAPTSAPVGCGELYVLAGALRYRGTSNTDTLLAAA